MGRYAGADKVEVMNARMPRLTEEVGKHAVVLLAARDGESAADHMPFAAVDVQVLDSPSYGDEETRSHVWKQRAGKGQWNYWMSDLKLFVGAALNKDAKEVSEADIESVFGEEQAARGVVLMARVYAKQAKNDPTKVYHNVAWEFLAEDVAELG